MKPVEVFDSIEKELAYLRKRVKVAYSQGAVRPENAADARSLLKGIAEALKPYVLLLEKHERAELFGRSDG